MNTGVSFRTWLKPFNICQPTCGSFPKTVPQLCRRCFRSVSSRATSRIPSTCDRPRRRDHDKTPDILGLAVREPPRSHCRRPSTRTPPSCCTSGCIRRIPFGHQRRGNVACPRWPDKSQDSRCKVLRCLQVKMVKHQQASRDTIEEHDRSTS